MTQYPNVKVVGMHFRGANAKEIAAALQPGDRLIIERESLNEFDPNAIKVIHPPTDQFIGFIEATQAVWISSEIDNFEALDKQCIAKVEVTGLETIRNNIHPIVTVNIDEFFPDDNTK